MISGQVDAVVSAAIIVCGIRFSQEAKAVLKVVWNIKEIFENSR